MPKQFFNIPLPNHEGLIELQAFLKKELTGATFQAPETFHITLVHVEDVGGADLSAIDIPFVPIFGVGGERIRVFNTPEGYAVTLAIEKVPQLVHLQTLLFNQMRAMGLDVSVHSWPGLYQPHVTLARTLIEPPFLDVPAMVHFQVEKFVLTAEGFEEVASFPLAQITALGEAVQEMATLREQVIFSEFKGSYPTVKIFPDVDIAALTTGDDDPDGGFVTLKIGKDDSFSPTNNKFYSAEWVKELEKWVYNRRPIGIQGHLTDQERSSKFPSPNIYWVGTAKVGDTLWGKGYIPIGETRDMVRRTRAVGGQLATSIYGKGKMAWDTQRGVWNVLPDTSSLEQIDLAPATRAGIPELAVVPQLTKEIAEMAGTDDVPDMEDENPMDKLTVIQEMTPADVKLLPDAVVNAVVDQALKPVQTQLAEIAAALKVEPDAVGQSIKELVEIKSKYEAVQTEQLKNVIVSTVSEFVCAEAKQETDAVKAVRQTVVELVEGRNPADEAAIKEVVKTVAEMPHIQTMVKAAVVSEMGPNTRRSPKSADGGQSSGGNGNKFLKRTPDELRKAQAS